MLANEQTKEKMYYLLTQKYAVIIPLSNIEANGIRDSIKALCQSISNSHMRGSAYM